MPQGTPPIKPRNTETVARETATGLFCQASGLMTISDPNAWEMAAQKFNEAADACRITAKALTERAEPKPLTPPHVHEFLKDYLGDLRPGPHQILVIGSVSDFEQNLRRVMQARERRQG